MHFQNGGFYLEKVYKQLTQEMAGNNVTISCLLTPRKNTKWLTHEDSQPLNIVFWSPKEEC